MVPYPLLSLFGTDIEICAGEGSFFKAHKDTPRGDDMFASLVLVLPSPHTGGELRLTHSNAEHIFDSGNLLSSSIISDPNVAYVAFYSDVDHEVQQVLSGHRVTITYNLYWKKDEEKLLLQSLKDKISSEPRPRQNIQIPTSIPFRETLTRLLASPSFLPNGGTLAIALQHLYPVPQLKKPSDASVLKLEPRLKGLDAIIAHTFTSVGLSPSIKVSYSDGYYIILTDTVAAWDQIDADDFFSFMIREDEEGKPSRPGTIISAIKPQYPQDWRYKCYGGNIQPVHWLTKPESLLQDKRVIATYGNQVGLEWVYGNFAFVVEIGPAGRRDENPILERKGKEDLATLP
jgi:hypothetical protein